MWCVFYVLLAYSAIHGITCIQLHVFMPLPLIGVSEALPVCFWVLHPLSASLHACGLALCLRTQ